MYATTFLVHSVSVLGLLAPAVLAQNRCQLFVTAPTGSGLKDPAPGFGEITRDCAVSPEGNKGSSQNDDACATLGFMDEFNTDESIFVPAGLSEDVEVRVFRDDLTEGFMKFAGQDLNFEGECEQVGSERKAVIRCEFDC